MDNKPKKISSGYIIHNKKKYTFTVTSTNEPSKEAIDNCRKYVNNVMRNLNK